MCSVVLLTSFSYSRLSSDSAVKRSAVWETTVVWTRSSSVHSSAASIGITFATDHHQSVSLSRVLMTPRTLMTFRMRIWHGVRETYILAYYNQTSFSATSTLIRPEEQPGRRGEFVDFTYKRFDGLTQKMRYSDLKKVRARLRFLSKPQHKLKVFQQAKKNKKGGQGQGSSNWRHFDGIQHVIYVYRQKYMYIVNTASSSLSIVFLFILLPEFCNVPSILKNL